LRQSLRRAFSVSLAPESRFLAGEATGLNSGVRATVRVTMSSERPIGESYTEAQ